MDAPVSANPGLSVLSCGASVPRMMTPKTVFSTTVPLKSRMSMRVAAGDDKYQPRHLLCTVPFGRCYSCYRQRVCVLAERYAYRQMAYKLSWDWKSSRIVSAYYATELHHLRIG